MLERKAAPPPPKDLADQQRRKSANYYDELFALKRPKPIKRKTNFLPAENDCN
jgi:hypothetical protein